MVAAAAAAVVVGVDLAWFDRRRHRRFCRRPVRSSSITPLLPAVANNTSIFPPDNIVFSTPSLYIN
jgi:hypothetical protein